VNRAPSTTILFIPFSGPPHKLETEWEKDCDKILRRCPVCQLESIIGHGRRRKAHDQHHDWIAIRRGRCPACRKTFTFLPLFTLPYTHYSLLARCDVLRRRFVEMRGGAGTPGGHSGVIACDPCLHPYRSPYLLFLRFGGRFDSANASLKPFVTSTYPSFAERDLEIPRRSASWSLFLSGYVVAMKKDENLFSRTLHVM
jgi:hypothetical protein